VSHPLLSPAAAAALLASLSAEFGPGVVASLLGASFAQDVAQCTADNAEDTPEGEEPFPPVFDDEWFAGFGSHEAFRVAAGPEALAAFDNTP